jgi:hypothetical protein
MSDESDFTLYRDRADFGSPTLVGVVTVIQPAPASVDWEGCVAVAMSDTVVMSTWSWIDNVNFEVSGYTTVTIKTDGADDDFQAELNIGLGTVGYPLTNSSLGLVNGDMANLEESLGSEMSATWPTDSLWTPNGDASTAHVSADEATAMVYGVITVEAVDTGYVVESETFQVSGQPDARIALENHPSTDAPVDFAYFME